MNSNGKANVQNKQVRSRQTQDKQIQDRQTKGKQTLSREIVLDMLCMMAQGNEYSNKLIRGTLDKYDYLPQQEKAFIKRLFEGCVERQIQLDYVIDLFSGTKTNKMKTVILSVLRMGVYQILFMDGVPDSAACNEAVKLAVKRGFSGLKGFVNGVLRNISRQKEAIVWPDEEKEPVHALSVCYSMPEWIVSKFLAAYGTEVTKQMLQAFLSQMPVSVRMDENLSEDEREKWLLSVEQSGIRAEAHPYLDYAFRLYDVPGMNQVPGFMQGIWNVQDVSSMLVAEIADIQKEMTILDVCAAPGGKSLHAACKLQKTGLVSARDLTQAKTDLILENASRGAYPNLEILTWDATCLREEDMERADIVLVDAPCSGLGIMGKKCDIRYRMTKEQMKEIVVLQREILDAVSRYVKKGGILIYSTCTINEQENQEQVQYLSEKGFVPESLDPYLPEVLKSTDTAKGYLQLLPGVHETDGFFMARLRRK